MSKIAGLKGRSPETYGTRTVSGLVQTQSEPNDTPVSLTNVAAPLVPTISALPAGFRNIILFSGALQNPSVGGAQVEVQVVIGGVAVFYSIIVEVSSTNAPAPFGLAFESGSLAEGSTIDIKALTIGGGQTATAVTGSAVIISTPT